MTLLYDRTKKYWRRVFRRRRRAMEELGQQADQNIERHVLRRLERLISVRRFVVTWILLFVLLLFPTFIQIKELSTYYQVLKPVAGGMYTEGLVGTFTNANPLYASGAADISISKLVFSGLFRYDSNNKLVGDLADRWSLDKSETRYSVTLKKGITWHDNHPFTADDVVFTYQTIQDNDAKSSFLGSWQGIKVSKQNEFVVNFALPSPLSSFPYALTNGIVPKHLLGDIPAAELRSASFNTQPIGTGPFQWKFVEVVGDDPLEREQRITLAPNPHYWAKKPKLDGLTIRTFHDDKRLLKAFSAKELNAMSGLESLPEELKDNPEIREYTVMLNSAAMAFFNTSHKVLNDPKVRKALVSAIDRKQVAALLNHPGSLVDGPLLRGQLGYDSSIKQARYRPETANNLLDAAGWKRNTSGERVKGGSKLSFNLSSQSTEQYTKVSQFLQKAWGQLGIDVQVKYYSSDDIQNKIIAGHEYDILLYGIGIGVDPDVFAYWHSSQASIASQSHLNLSEYRSKPADQALEAGRTRSNPKLRAIKYKPFLRAWVADAPALALYQPEYVYITRGPLFGYQSRLLNSSADRFNNVSQWMVREVKRNIE